MDKYGKWLIIFALLYIWYHIFMALPFMANWQ